VGRGPTLPPAPDVSKPGGVTRQRFVRQLTSTETWAMVALTAIVLVIVLWLLSYFLDSLKDPVRAAMDLVRLGPKSRGPR